MDFAKLPFEALVFDLGNVIIPHDNAALTRRLAGHCDAPDALDRVMAIGMDPRYGTGELPITALHDRLRAELGYRLDWDGFVEDWSSHLSLDPAMLAFVQHLAPTNRVMLFSNTNAEHWKRDVALTDGALNRIEAYLSHELGLQKPSVESFHAVAAKAGITPGRSLFIDDVQENIDGARLAGFQAELFTGQAALERFLMGRLP